MPEDISVVKLLTWALGLCGSLLSIITWHHWNKTEKHDKRIADLERTQVTKSDILAMRIEAKEERSEMRASMMATFTFGHRLITDELKEQRQMLTQLLKEKK